MYIVNSFDDNFLIFPGAKFVIAVQEADGAWRQCEGWGDFRK